MNYTLHLTQQQHSALVVILVDYARRPDSTQEWVDVLTDTTTTLSDLLTLVATAKPKRNA